MSKAPPNSPGTAAKTPTGEPLSFLAECEGLPLDQHIGQIYRDEVMRVLSIEIPDWDSDPLEKQVIERALSPDFWLAFDAAHQWPIVSAHDPLIGFQPSKPFDIEAVRAHPGVRRTLDNIRRTCFMQVVHALTARIAKGEVVALGRREPVATHDQAWVELPFGSMQDRRWRLFRGLSRVVILDEHGKEGAAFREVRLRARPAITEIGICPAVADNPSLIREKIPYERHILETWFNLRIQRWPKHLAPPAGVDCENAAMAEFSGLTRQDCREVRRSLVPKSWLKKGQRRPPK